MKEFIVTMGLKFSEAGDIEDFTYAMSEDDCKIFLSDISTKEEYARVKPLDGGLIGVRSSTIMIFDVSDRKDMVETEGGTNVTPFKRK